MIEQMPVTPEQNNQDTAEAEFGPERIIMTDEQRGEIFEKYLKTTDPAFDGDLHAATPDERKLADALLNMELERSDTAANAHFANADSNYIPDVEKRAEVFAELGFENGPALARHDIVLDRGDNQLSLKVVDAQGIADSIIFFGKTDFTEKGDSKYVELAPEDLERVRAFIQKQNSKSE